MSSLIVRVVLIGLVIGTFTSVFTMTLGLIINFTLRISHIYLVPFFMEKIALASVIIGIVCTVAWYVYILLTARAFFLRTVQNLFKKENEK